MKRTKGISSSKELDKWVNKKQYKQNNGQNICMHAQQYKYDIKKTPEKSTIKVIRNIYGP